MTIRINDGKARATCEPATMKSALLRLLRKQWVTPLDALNHVGCFSLSQRCGEFSRSGVHVQKRRVHLMSGKAVMAYRVGR